MEEEFLSESKQAKLMPEIKSRVFYLTVFGFLSLVLWTEFLVDLHLATDGSYYFVSVLDTKWFTDFAWERAHAVYLSQWLLYLTVKAGVTDLLWLKLSFAGGIYLCYVASFLTCVFAVRGEEPTLLLFPILGITAVNLPASFLLYGESQVAALFCWPILLLVLRRQDWDWADGLVVLLFAIGASRSYEAFLILALILGIATVHRLRSCRYAQRSLYVGCVLLLILAASAVTSFYSVVLPRDQNNKTGFLESIPQALGSIHSIVSICFLLAIFLGCKLRFRKTVGLSAVIGLMLFLLRQFGVTMGVIIPDLSMAMESFGSRSLILVLLPLLLVIACFFRYREVHLSRTSAAILSVYLLITALFQGRMAWEWSDYRKLFRAELEQRQGYVPFEETSIAGSPCSWTWTNPILSLVWSPGPVRTIILNKDELSWQPYDPRNHRALRRYVEYDMPRTDH
jgi:hypothetical protein